MSLISWTCKKQDFLVHNSS